MKIIKQNKKNQTEVVNFLNKGGVIIFPTDTVYGFMADATNKKAVDKIYKYKKRSKKKPLPVFVSDIKMAKIISVVDKKQEKLMKKYWPGKYTLVVSRQKNIKIYDKSKETIAIRIPRYNPLISIIKRIKKPLVQTSVNISDEPSLNKISEIVERFNGADILIVDGGDFKKNKASKIIDITGQKINILRK